MKPDPSLVLLLHHFKRLLETAAREGIDIAPLKGAHLLTGVYADDEDRGPMADVDFLVRPHDWNRAVTLLNGLGFKPRPQPLNETDLHEAGFLLDVGPGSQILFELHRYLFEPRRLPIDHDAVWRRSRPSTFDGVPCRRLSSEDIFVHVAVHAGIHRLMNLERALRDLELLLRRTDLNRDLMTRIARKSGMSRVVWLLLALLDETNPDLALRPWTARLAPSRGVRAALKLMVSTRGTTRLTHFHHRVQAALLWPWIFDSLPGCLRFVFNHPRLGSTGHGHSEQKDD